ncbi:hypothetical protein HNQ96_006014 [Aminobacter lissarensis]|uniref:Uncharacterized protein n=1 Tax=Aminobacter carboxidus TaxID=376165 RepID=A0A8E1WM53_9HYPH|nr:hypothetical protein [Aminobacter lissarensis]
MDVRFWTVTAGRGAHSSPLTTTTGAGQNADCFVVEVTISTSDLISRDRFESCRDHHTFPLSISQTQRVAITASFCMQFTPHACNPIPTYAVLSYPPAENSLF